MSIPKNIHQTFDHLDFSPEFQKIVRDWKIENPEYRHILHDKKSREDFIKNNFDSKIYDTYNRIKPGAFKVDLWRYCILYENGGFYVDVDTICLGSLDAFIKPNINFVAPIDLNNGDFRRRYNVANGFIGVTPKHPIMLDCINRIVEFVQTGVLPEWELDFAGPGCLGRAVNKFLLRKEEDSIVGFEGVHGNLVLLPFEENTEYVRDLTGKKIFQNKNGIVNVKQLYDQECFKVKDFIDWGESYRRGNLFDIINPNPFIIEPGITTLNNYHNNQPAYFSLYKFCGISDCIRRGWRWEEHQHDVVDQYLDSNSVVVEVGAHIGTLSVKISKVVKKLYCFEPMDVSFEMLNKNLELNNCTNVTTIKKGVSNTNSKTHVKWISDGNVGGTGLEGGGITRESNVSSRIEVELVTIDSMELEELHYLKIDVEGFEEMVIQGAEKTIAKFLPLIIIECFESIETGEIISEKTLGKRFKYLYDLGYTHKHVAFEDFLFIPPTIKQI